jgi:hypothetical protein
MEITLIAMILKSQEKCMDLHRKERGMKLLKATERWHQQTKDAVEKNKVELYSKITIEGHILEIIEQIVEAKKEGKKELSWRFMTLKGGEKNVLKEIRILKIRIKEIDETKDLQIKFKTTFDKGKEANRIILRASWK